MSRFRKKKKTPTTFGGELNAAIVTANRTMRDVGTNATSAGGVKTIMDGSDKKFSALASAGVAAGAGLFSSGLGLGDLAQLVGLAYTVYNTEKTQNHLTGNQKESNAWSAEQAQITRDWQEDFYNNHLSMPAKVQEYKDAGLNPYALAGSGVGATSAPSGAQASGASAAVNPFPQILGSILDYSLKANELDIQRELLPFQKMNLASQANRNDTWSDYHGLDVQSQVAQRLAAAQLALQRIDTEESQAALNRAGIPVANARAALTLEEAYNKFIENNYADRYYGLRNDLQEAQIKRMNAAAAKDWKTVALMDKQIDMMDHQIDAIDASFLETVARTENLRQQTVILGIDEDMKAFQRDHQKAEFIMGQIQGYTGVVCDVVGAATDVVGTVYTAGMNKAIGGAAKAGQFG